jgi:hypothetical protein
MRSTVAVRWRTTRFFFCFFPALPPECLSLSPLLRPVRGAFGFD